MIWRPGKGHNGEKEFRVDVSKEITDAYERGFEKGRRVATDDAFNDGLQAGLKYAAQLEEIKRNLNRKDQLNINYRCQEAIWLAGQGPPPVSEFKDLRIPPPPFKS